MDGQDWRLTFEIIVENEQIHLIDPEGILPPEDQQFLTDGIARLFEALLDKWERDALPPN